MPAGINKISNRPKRSAFKCPTLHIQVRLYINYFIEKLLLPILDFTVFQKT